MLLLLLCRCGHCQRLAPAWDELGSLFKSVDEVQVIKVDCTQHTATCTKQGVKGYPTLILFENGEPVSKYNGGRTLNDLVDFVKENVANKAPSDTAGRKETEEVELDGKVLD